MLAETPKNQAARLATIRRYDLGARLHEDDLVGLVELAQNITDCPIALVSIVHEDSQVFEVACGFDRPSTGLDESICSHAILQDDILEIEDCTLDPRTADNPLVLQNENPVRFYSGAQIVTRTGIVLGTLCVLDHKPRRLGDRQRASLRTLADQIMRKLELHDAVKAQELLRREVDHRVKNSLSSVSAMARMAASRAKSPEVREALGQIQSRIQVMVELHAELHRDAATVSTLEVSDYLRRVGKHLARIAPPGIIVEMEFDRLNLPSSQASAIGVLVNEMASNAFKHAFGDRTFGRLELKGMAVGQHYRVVCLDDGLGALAADNQDEKPDGLGHKIMSAAAQQLGGEISAGVRDDGTGGYQVTFTLPIAV